MTTMFHTRSSRLPGFFRLSADERIRAVAAFAGLEASDLDALSSPDGLPQAVAANMSENVVGRFSLPIAFATNFRVNGLDYVVPMVIEEPSVVAAASFAARLLRDVDGIVAVSTEPIMIGQIHFPDPPPEGVLEDVVERHLGELRQCLDKNHPRLIAAGGGFRGARVRRLVDPDGRPLAVVHIHVDVRDAMGANAVNSMAEEAGTLLSEWTGSRVGLRILSNLPIHRRVMVEGRVRLGETAGTSTMPFDEAERIEEASRFAEADPYRAVTANKGIMNGIDAVLLATGQDFRAVEAAAHAFAAYDGRYTALAKWRVEDGYMVGRMDIPLALGTVGGITSIHPAVRANFKILGVREAARFAEVVASVGLAQNLAATRALASEGIQRGHMRLHARTVAAEAGARPEEVPLVVAAMLARERTDARAAREELLRLRDGL
ncbi:MAG: hydroxymethylglutaryl-CoA reductase, degradative [Deltaproteobacteria bacterium HGW-Deltaproteobacteria-14]|jgi:hydroxymethylglutaryl-CoA reductase|nr:MAG: hydroxymethylglutaryl-CoA reductase, degradative [Deltaproteobacteria bacterium HGW-Deltaproteobacteria-14]